MISLTNHDYSEGEQWGRYNLPRYINDYKCIYIYIYDYMTIYDYIYMYIWAPKMTRSDMIRYYGFSGHSSTWGCEKFGAVSMNQCSLVISINESKEQLHSISLDAWWCDTNLARRPISFRDLDQGTPRYTDQIQSTGIGRCPILGLLDITL